LRAVLSFTLGLWLSSATLRSQSGLCNGLPCPPGFTFHVYVDPSFGDDRLAFDLNPKTSSTDLRRRPLADYPSTNSAFPDTSPGANNGSGILQHAPYSFRTLTGGVPGGLGGRGAIDYVMQNWPSGPPVTLPWTNPDNGRVVWWVVIHLLPGLYGPDSSIDPSLSDIDPKSGLRFNGEAFPVALPLGVSFQGTSALDTILDARELETGIIQTNGNPFGRQTTPGKEDYFVDSLTLRNARADGTQPIIAPFHHNTSGAAIWFGWEVEVQLTISNCFIVDNDVGIALEDSPLPPVNSPIPVNNTLAWNRIGIWNGFRDASAGPNQGNLLAVCFDNIVDTSDPDAPTEVNVAVQGLHQDDVTISSLLTVLGQTIPPAPQTPNAWDPSRVNVALPDPLRRPGLSPRRARSLPRPLCRCPSSTSRPSWRRRPSRVESSMSVTRSSRWARPHCRRTTCGSPRTSPPIRGRSHRPTRSRSSIRWSTLASRSATPCPSSPPSPSPTASS
jgi:hypothetical protein